MPRRALGLVACALALLLGFPSGAGAVPSGGVEAYGGAPALGGANQPSDAYRVIGVVGTPSGAGYWQYSVDGAVYPHGDAAFPGDLGGRRLNRPIVGMASTPTGQGYWLVASDGGIFSYGDAHFQGSTGAMKLNRPIVGMASTPTGLGYYLVATDGGIFTFGDAEFHGSGGGQALAEPVVGMTVTPTGLGYRMATVDGRVLAFGDAVDAGGAAVCRAQGVTGLAERKTGGYWLATAGVLPTRIPAGTDPIDTVSMESANMTTILRLYDGCRPTPAPTKGRFSSPLPGSVITSDYGTRIHPIYKKPQFHSGIDLAGSGQKLTDIRAAADGVVVQVQLRQGFGLATIVDHGDGTATVYCHQSAVRVKAGQAVKRGQIIGTVGHTGYATADHLHFEVRVHGVPSDPKKWL
ncbi:MAG: Peptidase [Actinomycetia bacterium]|nr:Peptidase [Actinomycetes bacterium]